MTYLLTDQETSRLHFRLLQESDFEAWKALFDRPQVARFLGLDPALSPTELCQKWFDKVFHRYANDLGGMNVLVDKESGQMVGQCGLLVQTVAGEKRLEVGYSVLPAHQNRGYASEAAQKCRDYAFEQGYTDTLISIVDPDNICSERVARKNGMDIEQHAIDFNGSTVNIFALTRAQWTKAK